MGEWELQWPPSTAKVYGVQMEEPRQGLRWVQSMKSDGRGILILSRLSPRRLSRAIRLDGIQFRWLTERNDPHALQPSLEQLNHYISNFVNNGSGIIWLDAVEYLSELNGFEATMHFIETLSDTLVGLKWELVLPYSPLAFSSTEVARLRRGAPNLDILSELEHDLEQQLGSGDDTDLLSTTDTIQSPAPDVDDDPNTRQEEGVSGLPEKIEIEEGLVVLSRIPESSLSRAILSRRLEQWKELGFDISEVEPILLIEERAERYRRYFAVEELVRRASECERRIRELEALGFTTEATKLRFRIMQLTGIDDVERTISSLLAEAR